jgi:hypothetical protein
MANRKNVEILSGSQTQDIPGWFQKILGKILEKIVCVSDEI